MEIHSLHFVINIDFKTYTNISLRKNNNKKNKEPNFGITRCKEKIY